MSKAERNVAALVESFFGRLELLRGNRTKASFANEIGASAPLYQKWSKGSIPGGDKLMLISEATGKSVEWLLTGKEGMTSLGNLRLIREAVAAAAADPSAPGSAAKLLTAVDCLDDLINAAEGRDLLKATFPRRIFLKPAARKAVAR